MEHRQVIEFIVRRCLIPELDLDHPPAGVTVVSVCDQRFAFSQARLLAHLPELRDALGDWPQGWLEAGPTITDLGVRLENDGLALRLLALGLAADLWQVTEPPLRRVTDMPLITTFLGDAQVRLSGYRSPATAL